MNEQFFQPYTFNNSTTVKNRLFMAPMTNGQSDADGRFSEEELNWLGYIGSVRDDVPHVTGQSTITLKQWILEHRIELIASSGH